MVRMAQTWRWAIAATVIAGCSDPGPSSIDAATIDANIDSATDAVVDGPGVDASALATGLTSPRALALAAGHVYVVTGGDSGVANGSVARVPIGGGDLQTLASGQSTPHGLQVRDRVYWTNSTFLAANGRSLRAMALTGGADVSVAALSPGPFALAVDATTAYVSRIDGNRALTAVPLAGGEPDDLTVSGTIIRDLDVDATHIYYVDGGAVRRLTKSGGAAPELLATSFEPQALAGHGDTLYWTSLDKVMRVGRDGTGLATVATASRLAGAIAVDDTYVYVGERADGIDDGRILRVPVGGGELVPITTAHHTPFALAVDDAAVYWTDSGAASGQGAIYKVAK